MCLQQRNPCLAAYCGGELAVHNGRVSCSDCNFSKDVEPFWREVYRQRELTGVDADKKHVILEVVHYLVDGDAGASFKVELRLDILAADANTAEQYLQEAEAEFVAGMPKSAGAYTHRRRPG